MINAPITGTSGFGRGKAECLGDMPRNPGEESSCMIPRLSTTLIKPSPGGSSLLPCYRPIGEVVTHQKKLPKNTIEGILG